jgi:aspartate-semialdehyde dehydrogenase
VDEVMKTMGVSDGRLEVGVLGATGTVGQQFIALLAEHPWFRLAYVAASERSEGKLYEDAAPWRLASPMPDLVRRLRVEAVAPDRGPKVLFSALDAAAADVLEAPCAQAGHVVLSNARSHRMDPLVPLLIPEVNADHLSLLIDQRREKGWSGAVVTNPNCAVVVLAMALAPLRTFGIRQVLVTTMQAVSGAGYPGVASLDILGNLIPYIGGGEEEKIERETGKILGTDGGRAPHAAVISAQVNRVPVIDGHSMTVSIDLEARPSVDDVVAALRAFRGRPQVLNLPTAPDPPIVVRDEIDRPQPRLDAGLSGGMAVSVGRVRPCPVLWHKFVALGHNTIRGAAGASVLNAELMKAEGLL